MSAQDPSEQFVYDVCSKSFFALWSYLNPLRDDGKELCDILVRFGRALIIISVKDIDFNEASDDPSVAMERWKRRAVEKSVKSVKGAERYLLQKGSFTVEASPNESLTIDHIERLRIHKISVSLGSQGHVPYGDAPKDGFVHVLDEQSFWVLLNELDTISDFVEYLEKKEKFFERARGQYFMAGEEDLLAIYLRGDREFPEWEFNAVLIEHGAFQELSNNPKFQAKKSEDRISYLVDHIIDEVITHNAQGTMLLSTPLSQLEKTLAVLASENRFGRRILGNSISEIVNSGSGDDIVSRIHYSESTDALYVIVAAPRHMSREQRREVLTIRCHVALGLLRDRLNRLQVLGIATETRGNGEEHSYDLLLQTMDEWTDDAQREMEHYQQEYGVFTNVVARKEESIEYPDA
jgi:hypothetical protein